MEMQKDISIRGRMAYLICSFERLLIHTGINIEEWEMVLDKLWAYTSVDYIDDWMYELAEYMPNCILEDTMDDICRRILQKQVWIIIQGQLYYEL